MLEFKSVENESDKIIVEKFEMPNKDKLYNVDLLAKKEERERNEREEQERKARQEQERKDRENWERDEPDDFELNGLGVRWWTE